MQSLLPHQPLHSSLISQHPALMASTASPFSLSLPKRRWRVPKPRRTPVMASDASGSREGSKPSADTRIHWSSPDEGWIGGKTATESSKQEKKNTKEFLGEKFADLINDSATSHYQFLGVPAEADDEQIKSAFRRLSKEYHPDTTSLPLNSASEKFVRLREAYDVLGDEEKRRFYDWTLAQEAESERMRAKLSDPYEQDLENYVPVPDTVNRLGGRNMELSDQAKTALTIDIFIIFFSICSIIYVVFFKEPY